jgi:hypothetical protein
MREGKIQYETLRNVLLHNSIDLWLNESEIECLIEFLDPCIDTKKAREGIKIDYVTLLFQIEKPTFKEASKNVKIPSLTY